MWKDKLITCTEISWQTFPEFSLWAAVERYSFMSCTGGQDCNQAHKHKENPNVIFIFSFTPYILYSFSCIFVFLIYTLPVISHYDKQCVNVSLPASKQSQVSVAFKAMATKWGFCCPRTETSKLWQVNLLTQSVRAKFTELVNTVVFSCNWSQRLSAFPWRWRNMKVKKINYWAHFKKKQCLLYIQYTGNSLGKSCFQYACPCFVLMGELEAHTYCSN